jgi:large subunit ribosomal protein L22
METTVYLRNCSHSPRKMRLLVDIIRGMRVDKALYTLKVHNKRMYAKNLENLLRAALSSWTEKFPSERVEDNGLLITQVKVDGARVLKRVQPAPQGRAHRVRKRYNHITLSIGNGGIDIPVEKVKAAPAAQAAPVAEPKKKTTKKATAQK